MNMLELGAKAGAAITAGKEACKSAIGTASPSGAAARILDQLKSWEPTVKGKKILTPALRVKLANGFGHLAFNIWAAESGRELE